MIFRRSGINFIYLLIIQATNFLIPLITFPLIAKNKSIEVLGTLSIIQNIFLISSVIIDYGYVVNGTKYVAINSHSEILLGKFVTRAIMVKIFLFFLSSIFIFILIALFYSHLINVSNSLFIIFLLFISLFNLPWLFQGLEKIAPYSFFILIVRSVSTLLLFVFISRDMDLKWLILIIFSSQIAGSLYSALFVYKNNYVKLYRFNLFKELLDGIYYFLPNVYSIIFSSAGLLILGAIADPVYVGGYAMSEKIVKAFASISGPVNQISYPLVAKSMNVSVNEGNDTLIKLIKIFSPIFITITILLLIFGGRALIILFGDSYDEFRGVMKFLPLYIVFGFINTFIGVIYMTVQDMQKEYSKAFLIALLVSLFIYSAFTKTYSFYASAAGLVLGELVLSVGIIFSILRKWSRNA